MRFTANSGTLDITRIPFRLRKAWRRRIMYGMNGDPGLRILFVHGETAIGGGETDLLRLLAHLAAHGDATAVIAPPGGGLAERLAAAGVPQFGIPVPGWRKTRDLLKRSRFFREAGRAFDAFSPRLVVANDVWYAPHARRLAERAGVPWAAHVRGELKGPGRVRQYDLDRAGAVLTMADSNVAGLRAGGVAKERIRLIPAGIDPRVPEPDRVESARKDLPPGRSPIVGIVANVLAVKGYEILEEAIRLLARTFPALLCVVVGSADSEFGRRYRSRIGKSDLAHHFLFRGFLEDPLPHVALFDVMLLPSLSEGFGIVLLEGMSLRKPVVASATGGIPGVVEDGRTGFLVPPGDASALAEKTSLLLSDPAMRERMGEEGYRRCVSRFGREDRLSEVREAYLRLCGR